MQKLLRKLSFSFVFRDIAAALDRQERFSLDKMHYVVSTSMESILLNVFLILHVLANRYLYIFFLLDGSKYVCGCGCVYVCRGEGGRGCVSVCVCM